MALKLLIEQYRVFGIKLYPKYYQFSSLRILKMVLIG